MKTALGWSAFSLGALICLANFYFSFLRYPLHRLRGFQPESYRWVSGIPMLGTLLVGLSLVALHTSPIVLYVAVALMLVDTGGPLWFGIAMLYQWEFGIRVRRWTQELNQVREFQGTYVSHWECPRFEWETGRRRWFGLMPERVLCELEFENGVPPEISQDWSDAAAWRQSPAIRFRLHIRGSLIEKGWFGHRGWCSFKLKVSKVFEIKRLPPHRVANGGSRSSE